MRHMDDAMDSLLRTALAEYAAAGVPGRSAAVGRRVHARVAAGAGRRRTPGRRVVLALVAAAVALALATGVALAATGAFKTQRIVQVPAALWQQHFAEQHHGVSGKGSAGPAQEATLAEAQRQAGFRIHTLDGLGARLTRVTYSTVTFRDGSQEPEVVVDYAVGDVTVSLVELKDPNPSAPYEIPNARPGAVRTINGAQYLFGTDPDGRVRYIQFKTPDGIVFSVNFYGPPYPDNTGPGGVDPQLATNVISHIR